jgi:hypothetical protein
MSHTSASNGLLDIETHMKNAQCNRPLTLPLSALLLFTCLERLHKRVEEYSDVDAPPEQLDEPGRPEELEEADGDHLGGVHNAPHNSDKVKGVPAILEVVLQSLIRLHCDAENTETLLERHQTPKTSHCFHRWGQFAINHDASCNKENPRQHVLKRDSPIFRNYS